MVTLKMHTVETGALSSSNVVLKCMHACYLWKLV